MPASLLIADVVSFLQQNNWRIRPEQWNGAGIWRRGTTEVLVPPRDGMGDSTIRLREVLNCLAEVENRDPADVAHDIANPNVDSANYVLEPGVEARRGVELLAGVHAVQAVHRLLGIAAPLQHQPRHIGGIP